MKHSEHIQQIRQHIAEGQLEKAANALVRFLGEEWMSKGDSYEVTEIGLWYWKK